MRACPLFLALMIASCAVVPPKIAAAAVPRADRAPVEPGCSQCGLWQLEGSSPDVLGGQLVFVDREHLVIPDCISSKYEINRTPEETSNDQNRGKFLVSILTTSAWDTGFLCPYNTLAVRFTGSEFDDNAGQWKKIIIDVRSSGGKQVILKLFGVNALMSSANPCNEGSAGGTIQCGLFAANAAYRMLALQVESTLDEPRAGRPYFKLPRFYEHAERYCERANRSIGSGSWPTAHVSGCLETILERKVREFIAWRACKDEHRPGDKRVCKVPTENFDTHGTVGP